MLFDFTEIPAEARYKLLVSTVTPRPIAWVVSQDSSGLVNAAPFSFFNAMSMVSPGSREVSSTASTTCSRAS